MMMMILLLLLLLLLLSVFLECLSMSNMLKCAEQVQIQNYKTHAYGIV